MDVSSLSKSANISLDCANILRLDFVRVGMVGSWSLLLLLLSAFLDEYGLEDPASLNLERR
jgi:hypothetical protein